MKRFAVRLSGRQSTTAFVASLALWLQVLIPAVGTTIHVYFADATHAEHRGVSHSMHHGERAPSRPAPDHDHLGLCCIIGGGKLGTGFAPPPSVPLSGLSLPVLVVPVAYANIAIATPASQSFLPVGARAPPRFL